MGWISQLWKLEVYFLIPVWQYCIKNPEFTHIFKSLHVKPVEENVLTFWCQLYESNLKYQLNLLISCQIYCTDVQLQRKNKSLIKLFFNIYIVTQVASIYLWRVERVIILFCYCIVIQVFIYWYLIFLLLLLFLFYLFNFTTVILYSSIIFYHSSFFHFYFKILRFLLYQFYISILTLSF